MSLKKRISSSGGNSINTVHVEPFLLYNLFLFFGTSSPVSLIHYCIQIDCLNLWALLLHLQTTIFPLKLFAFLNSIFVNDGKQIMPLLINLASNSLVYLRLFASNFFNRSNRIASTGQLKFWFYVLVGLIKIYVDIACTPRWITFQFFNWLVGIPLAGRTIAYCLLHCLKVSCYKLVRDVITRTFAPKFERNITLLVIAVV